MTESKIELQDYFCLNENWLSWVKISANQSF